MGKRTMERNKNKTRMHQHTQHRTYIYMKNKIDINTWSPHGDLMTKDGGGTMKCTRSPKEPQAYQYRSWEIWIINQHHYSEKMIQHKFRLEAARTRIGKNWKSCDADTHTETHMNNEAQLEQTLRRTRTRWKRLCVRTRRVMQMENSNSRSAGVKLNRVRNMLI